MELDEYGYHKVIIFCIVIMLAVFCYGRLLLQWYCCKKNRPHKRVSGDASDPHLIGAESVPSETEPPSLEDGSSPPKDFFQEDQQRDLSQGSDPQQRRIDIHCPSSQSDFSNIQNRSPSAAVQVCSPVEPSNQNSWIDYRHALPAPVARHEAFASGTRLGSAPEPPRVIEIPPCVLPEQSGLIRILIRRPNQNSSFIMGQFGPPDLLPGETPPPYSVDDRYPRFNPSDEIVPSTQQSCPLNK